MNSPKLVNMYKTRIPHSKYLFKDGTIAQFIGDRFTTSNPAEIAQLDAEIAGNHPTFYTEPGRAQVDPADLDPELSYKKKVISDYLAGVLDASGSPKRDMGTSSVSQIKPASSLSIAPITAGHGTAFIPTAQNIPSGLAAALDLVSGDSPAVVATSDPDLVAGKAVLDIFN